MKDEEKTRVKAAIASAKSMEEVRRLEQQLRDGWIPE